MPMHFPFTPNHVQLVSACYPPNAVLLTSGPEYRPNAQELSRMTYYASNRPGKINKLASELEKRTKLEVRKAKAGNTRSRAALLITLAILKALVTECKRDIGLLSASLLASVHATLDLLSSDLEVAVRAASVFTAWTTYTDGHLIGVDQTVTQDYFSCLQIFSRMGLTNVSDQEVRNRTRLIGLASVTGVVISEALYHSSAHFKTQVSTLVPALVAPLLEVNVSDLEEGAIDLKEQPSSPYLSEFRNRPAMERRAASIHLHVAGELGPSAKDVAKSSMRALSTLFEHSSGTQAGLSIQAVLDCLQDMNAWEKEGHARWIAIRAAEWTQHQYRYAVPTQLVDCLITEQDVAQSTSRHRTLVNMVASIFTSPTSIVNLSTSDIISSLINVVIRRVAKDSDDSLLAPLVGSISSLGTHVHYPDQIQDLAGELISRLVVVEASGVLVSGSVDSGKARIQAVRCLLAGLLGLLNAAEVNDFEKLDSPLVKGLNRSGTVVKTSSSRPTSPSLSDGHVKPSRRSNVTPETWQDTLTLLCDADYAVREDYSASLVLYLKKEIPKLGDYTDADGVKRIHPAASGPVQHASTVSSAQYGDSTIRFLNALHAQLYVLSTSSTLGLNQSASTLSSPQRSEDGDGAPPTITTEDISTTGGQDGEGPHRSLALPRARKTSIMLRILRNSPSRLSSAAPVSATVSDYGNVLGILQTVHEYLPIRGLLTSIPMLLALDHATKGEVGDDIKTIQRVKAIREVVARTWYVIGKVWDCPEVVEVAEKALAEATEWIPHLHDPEPGTFPPAHQPVTFEQLDASALEKAAPALDLDALVSAIASNVTVQDATGLDQASLVRKFTASWSPESAFRDSIEPDVGSAGFSNKDSVSPLMKVAPALMHLENLSRASLARSNRGVGVTDLREALEGRRSLSNPNLSNTAGSISTLEHTSVHHGDPHFLKPVKSRPQQRAKPAGPGEVKDVLNKLGIGKTSGNGLLKPSFSAGKNPGQRSVSAAIPPYQP